jgi:hypothetical protein
MLHEEVKPKEIECGYCGRVVPRRLTVYSKKLEGIICFDCQEEIEQQENVRRNRWI